MFQVREALQDDPVQVEDFVSLLHDFEQLAEGQEVMPLFRKLRSILGDQGDLLRDFAAFLHPEQALQCGLVRASPILRCHSRLPWKQLILCSTV